VGTAAHPGAAATGPLRGVLRRVHDLHVHLLAAVPNASYLEAHGFGLERFMAEPLRLEDGKAIAPERPGHGVELDWPALDALRA
jgi:L-alanine-DL-glutamate epimerase-like enolase superfamily enzyme